MQGGRQRLVDPTDPRVALSRSEFLRTGGFRGELTYRRADGSRIPCDVWATRVTAEDGSVYVIVSIRDLTGQKAVEAELHRSEAIYHTLVDALDEGVVLQGEDGAIVASNPRAECILGLASAQMAGRQSVDPRWQACREDGSPFPGDEHPAMVALRTGEPASAVMGVRKPDGALSWIAVRARPLLAPGGDRPHAVVTVFMDITEQRAAAAERERLAQEAQAVLQRRIALLDVAQALAAETDREQLLRALAHQARRLAGAEHCGIVQWDPVAHTVTTVASTTASVRKGRIAPDSIGMVGVVLDRREPVVVNDYQAEFAHQPEAHGHQSGTRAMAAVPLMYEGRVIGVLMVRDTDPTVRFSAEVVENLQILAGLAAALFVGIERTQLAAVTMAARALMHRLNNFLAMALGSLEVGVQATALPPTTQLAIRDATRAMTDAADLIARFGRLDRFETVVTPVGLALDLDASGVPPAPQHDL